jgi:LuxR family maltose regulon positive regulatory protein
VLADGDPQQARHIAHAVAGAAEATAPVVVEAWLLLAMLAARDDDVGQARESLRRALRSAAPESHRRAVYQVWTQLRQIVRDDDELVERYRELTAGTRRRRPAPHSAATAAPVMVERLSKRELDVLQGMAALLPTEEIAASMYISINTVKTHVRSILRKLAASRRNEAVRRARELRLI